MKYLIMKCEPLNDQFECDCNRTPMYITDEDWLLNYPKDYMFEVWAIEHENEIKLIKEYDEAMEKGMVYGYYDDESEDFHLIQKYPYRTRKEKCPKRILNELKNMKNFKDRLKRGYISAEANNKMYVYGEYFDNHMPLGY